MQLNSDRGDGGKYVDIKINILFLSKSPKNWISKSPICLRLTKSFDTFGARRSPKFKSDRVSYQRVIKLLMPVRKFICLTYKLIRGLFRFVSASSCFVVVVVAVAVVAGLEFFGFVLFWFFD